MINYPCPSFQFPVDGDFGVETFMGMGSIPMNSKGQISYNPWTQGHPGFIRGKGHNSPQCQISRPLLLVARKANGSIEGDLGIITLESLSPLCELPQDSSRSKRQAHPEMSHKVGKDPQELRALIFHMQ